MSFVKWFRRKYQEIQESNDAIILEPLQKENEEIKEINKRQYNFMQKQSDIISELNDKLILKDNEIERLEEGLNKVSSTGVYLAPTNYPNKEWKPNKRVSLPETLQNFTKDKEYQEKYLNKFKVKDFDNPDDVVYYTYKAVQSFINDKYKSDKKAFGTSEYWLSPQEAFDFYIKGKYADCEDVRTLLYGAIVSNLINQGYWEEHKDRLQCIDIGITGSFGHAILAWEKDNSTWANLETTYVEQNFDNMWKYDKDVFKSIYVNIIHIFNEYGEYKLV